MGLLEVHATGDGCRSGAGWLTSRMAVLWVNVWSACPLRLPSVTGGPDLPGTGFGSTGLLVLAVALALLGIGLGRLRHQRSD